MAARKRTTPPPLPDAFAPFPTLSAGWLPLVSERAPSADRPTGRPAGLPAEQAGGRVGDRPTERLPAFPDPCPSLLFLSILSLLHSLLLFSASWSWHPLPKGCTLRSTTQTLGAILDGVPPTLRIQIPVLARRKPRREEGQEVPGKMCATFPEDEGFRRLIQRLRDRPQRIGSKFLHRVRNTDRLTFSRCENGREPPEARTEESP